MEARSIIVVTKQWQQGRTWSYCCGRLQRKEFRIAEENDNRENREEAEMPRGVYCNFAGKPAELLALYDI